MSPEQFVAAVQQLSAPIGDGTGTSCNIYPACPACQQDPTFEICNSWHQSQLQDMVNSNMLNGANSFSPYKRNLGRRSFTLTCTDVEGCVAAADGLYLCIDVNTFDFKDVNGGSGNVDSDTYTMSNGEVTSLASTATALPTPTGSDSKTSATASGSGSKSTSTSAALTSKTGDSSSAANSKAEGFLQMMLIVMGAANVLL